MKKQLIISKEQEQKWVALARNRKDILGFSASLSELTRRVGKGGGVTYMKVPRSDISFVF